MRRARGFRIDNLREHAFRVPGITQRMDDDVGIAGGAGGCGVCRVGEDHRAVHPTRPRDRPVERNQLALHPVAQWPELARDPRRFAAFDTMFLNVGAAIGISAGTALIMQESQIRAAHLFTWAAPLNPPFKA
jgi:hypothetical protein